MSQRIPSICFGYIPEEKMFTNNIASWLKKKGGALEWDHGYRFKFSHNKSKYFALPWAIDDRSQLTSLSPGDCSCGKSGSGFQAHHVVVLSCLGTDMVY